MKKFISTSSLFSNTYRDKIINFKKKKKNFFDGLTFFVFSKMVDLKILQLIVFEKYLTYIKGKICPKKRQTRTIDI